MYLWRPDVSACLKGSASPIPPPPHFFHHAYYISCYPILFLPEKIQMKDDCDLDSGRCGRKWTYSGYTWGVGKTHQITQDDLKPHSS